jgi:predicted transglutaminase-like protease
MLYVIERKRPIRTLRGWAIATLQEAGAIRQCEYHGWLVDCADLNARERALEIARQELPANISPRRAITEMLDVLDGIADTCPDCSLDRPVPHIPELDREG